MVILITIFFSVSFAQNCQGVELFYVAGTSQLQLSNILRLQSNVLKTDDGINDYKFESDNYQGFVSYSFSALSNDGLSHNYFGLALNPTVSFLGSSNEPASMLFGCIESTDEASLSEAVAFSEKVATVLENLGIQIYDKLTWDSSFKDSGIAYPAGACSSWTCEEQLQFFTSAQASQSGWSILGENSSLSNSSTTNTKKLVVKDPNGNEYIAGSYIVRVRDIGTASSRVVIQMSNESTCTLDISFTAGNTSSPEFQLFSKFPISNPFSNTSL